MKKQAHHGGVGVAARVPALGLLAAVGVRTLRPVVAARPQAPPDLVRVHLKLVGGEDRLYSDVKLSLVDEFVQPRWAHHSSQHCR